ncbi:MAG: Stk1 family PASTA domain-containing Ser/Thr kinase [Bacilli bacterium]|nr:Stk1 family PASTA domain-containing Ser/Thr kinase [Bacilli bacterium]
MIMKGQKISERYQIIKSIGEGGMANVYLAYDTILDRNVAVKVLRGDLATDEKFVRRFQREALSASSLNHPNIVEVYDVGEDNGQYYIVMEYIDGKHLKNLLKKRGKLTVSEVVDIMLQITDGMSVAHDSYIIHRDIKPQNIMILENGMVKITDFGIAMAMNATQLTQTNSVMGSVHYLPPEQANGKGATLQSDIYSMGILMYELLTGKLPYKGDNAVEIALKHLKEPLPSIMVDLPNLPQSIENIILRSTAKNPKNRYLDAREMHEDLKTCLEESRRNEPRVRYKFPEFDYDDARMAKMVQESKKVNKPMTDEEIAIKINPDEEKKQNKLLIILLSIFTGLIVIVTSIFLLLPAITNQAKIEIPDVVGMPVEEAIEKLQDKGFVISDDEQEISSSDVAEGCVVKTNPNVGTKKKKGTEIVLYVSTGSSKIAVEDYTGKNYLEIKGALEAQGVKVLVEKKDIDDENKYGEGEIIDQSKKSGEELESGDTITIYIPNIVIKYPDFTDGSFNITNVQNFAETNGLTVEIEEIETSEYQVGTIFYQSKPAGYTVLSGSSFKIKVAIAPTSSESDDVDADNIGVTDGLQ